MAESMKQYHERIQEALDDDFLRKTLDKFAVQYKANRVTIFADMDAKGLIAEIAESKDKAMARVEELYQQFV